MSQSSALSDCTKSMHLRSSSRGQSLQVSGVHCVVAMFCLLHSRKLGSIRIRNISWNFFDFFFGGGPRDYYHNGRSLLSVYPRVSPQGMDIRNCIPSEENQALQLQLSHQPLLLWSKLGLKGIPQSVCTETI